MKLLFSRQQYNLNKWNKRIINKYLKQTTTKSRIPTTAFLSVIIQLSNTADIQQELADLDLHYLNKLD